MHRLVLTAVLLASACGSATDDRPATLEFITETILAPTCAAAECHSAFKQQVGDVFDTPEATRQTIVANALAPVELRDAPATTPLVLVLTVGLDSLLNPSSGKVRMPYVSAMPDADVQLIQAWIAGGVLGAQCVPNTQGLGCQAKTVMVGANKVTEYDVVDCADGNAGAIVTVCPMGQICDFRKGNGQCVPQ